MSSSGSLNTSASHSHVLPSFCFSSELMKSSSFSDLLANGNEEMGIFGQQDLINTTTDNHHHHHHLNWGFSDRGIPKFKSIPPPSLPLSPPPVSPSSYFSIPPGMSPTSFLDSPVLLSSSHAFPSPTTGSFSGFTAFQDEIKNGSDFSFQFPPQTGLSRSSNMFPLSTSSSALALAFKREEEEEFVPVQAMIQSEPAAAAGAQYRREQRKCEDGYNWRKYGQKQVKGSENPRSYYKCTYPNCPTKKKVEKNLQGEVTEIVYKGTHNHSKPQPSSSSRKSTSNAAAFFHHPSSNSDCLAITVATTPENSSVSFCGDGDDDNKELSNSITKSEDDENNNNHYNNGPDAKKWKGEGLDDDDDNNENEAISANGNKTVREPRVVVQTTSDIDILDDGYRWRKYGQKVVKGNPNPRSYYKCTTIGCPVRKHVERASQDLRSVITTYEGKHNHDVPAPRGSGSYAVNRQLPMPAPGNNIINGSTSTTIRRMSGQQQAPPHRLDLIQWPGSYNSPGFQSSMGGGVGGGGGHETQMSSAKKETTEESFFDSFLR